MGRDGERIQVVCQRAVTEQCHLYSATYHYYCATNVSHARHTISWAVPANVQQWVPIFQCRFVWFTSPTAEQRGQHFKGQFVHWDVNNELLHGDYFGQRLAHGSPVDVFSTPLARSGREVICQRLQRRGRNEPKLTSNRFRFDFFQCAIDASAPRPLRRDDHPPRPRRGLTVLPSLPAHLDHRIRFENADENIRADNLEVLYRIAFSKQAVTRAHVGFWRARTGAARTRRL